MSALQTIPEREIGLAVLGASGALAGILLIFVGLLFARADSIPSEITDVVSKKFRSAAAWGLAPVFVCAAVMMTSYEWLFCPTSSVLRLSWRWGFWVETVSFVIYAFAAVRMLGRT